jgi:hypothetical protein
MIEKTIQKNTTQVQITSYENDLTCFNNPKKKKKRKRKEIEISLMFALVLTLHLRSPSLSLFLFQHFAPIDLINDIPPIEIETRTTYCDGGNENRCWKCSQMGNRSLFQTYALPHLYYH